MKIFGVNKMEMIVTNDLGKTFKSGKYRVEAVKQVNLQIGPGEIFGFLGPNGAGKTTTLRMLTTLMTPSHGSAAIMGFDLARETRKIRQQIGYVSQRGGCYGFATGLENLVLQGRRYGLSKADAVANAGTLKLFVEAGEKALPKILPLLISANLPITSIEMKLPSLDEVLLSITGRILNSATGDSIA
jgi:ABC-type uncharacterized transport system ATPase subunit